MARTEGVFAGSFDYQLLVTALPLKYRLLWEAGGETGLRVSDLLALRTCDLARKMDITEIKTGKVRTVVLSERLYALLRRFGGSVFVWESPRDVNRPLSRKNAWRAFKAAQRASGIGINIGTHSMRKTYAITRLNGGYTVSDLQSDFGHATVNATACYIPPRV